MNNLVSVIITTKNRSSILKTAIESARNQTYNNLEILIVDDGSTDDTKKVCKEYCKIDSRIVYKRIDYINNKGGNHVRNVGILECRGEYIAFLDDDDEWSKDKIEKQIEFLHINPNYSLVCTDFINKYIFKDKIYSYRSHVEPASDRKHYMVNGSVSITSTILVKRDAIIDAGMFDEELKAFQEVEMSYRIRLKHNIGFISEPLTIYNHYCNNNNSLAISNSVDKYLESIKYVNKKYKFILDKLDENTIKDREYSIYWDCVERSLRGNDNKNARRYMLKALKINPSIKIYLLYIASFILDFKKIIYLKSLYAKA